MAKRQPMLELSHRMGAVFISYCSQDAPAAERICEALRAAGIDAWLDKNQLRGGDAWDAQIRRRIHECALFIPVISAHTNMRSEGYFRREWKQATHRLQDMADDVAFLVPVVIDSTREPDARVPDEFLQAQWTWLPDGETPPAFPDRVKQLLRGEPIPKLATQSEGSSRHEPVARKVGAGQPRFWFSLRGKDRQLGIGLSIVTLLLATSGGVFWYYKDKGDMPLAKEASSGLPTEPAAPNDRSIAVLPFVNMSSDREQEYFSDGLSEELLNLLAQVPDLRVIARTSSFAFKGQNVEIAEIARKLNVAHVLEGSVRKSGDTLRITAQLVRAADSSHLWSHTYDRQMTGVFEVQGEIAQAVVSELKIKLLATTPRVRPTEAEAYTLYLRASKASAHDVDAIRQSVSQYKQALAIDPSYAPAWDGLAHSYYTLLDSGITTTAQTLPLARNAISRAMTSDPEYAPAYARAALIEGAVEGNLAAAARYLEQGLVLDPQNLDLIDAAVKITRRLGKLDQSLVLAKYHARRDPVSVTSRENLAWAYYLTDRFDDAIAEFRIALSLKPDADVLHESLGEVLLQKGDPRAALLEMQKEPFELQRLVGLSMAYHALDQKQESDAALNDLIRKGEQTIPYYISYVLAFRGESNRAFQWLEKAIEYRDPYVSWTHIDAKFNALHSDTCWLPLLRRIGQAPEQLAAVKLNISMPN